MRPILTLSILALSVSAAEADRYFEAGLTYLKRGHFGPARAAFAESLLRAPGEPVTTALIAVAAAAEGYGESDIAALVRAAYRRLPRDQAFGFDLGKLLPSKTLAHLKKDFAASSSWGARQVLAFLETHDADPQRSDTLAKLAQEKATDQTVRAMGQEQAVRQKARERAAAKTARTKRAAPSGVRP